MKPYIYEIVLHGHVQTFVLMWVSSNVSSDVCCFRFEDSHKICREQMFAFVFSFLTAMVNN